MNIRKISYLVLALSALTFLFFLGFPFGNHNESYEWVAQFRTSSFVDVLTKPVKPVSNFRPLGIAFAWMTFKAANGGLWLQQLCNWALTLVAWSILFYSARGKALLGLTALLVTGVFFSGYIFLFHLHGVFYGPLLIFIAILIRLSDQDLASVRQSVLLFLLTLLMALIHPFALVIYGFYLVASTWEVRLAKRRSQLLVNAVLLCLAIGAYKLLLSEYETRTLTSLVLGFVVSYRMLEINAALSIAAYLLSMFVLVTFEMSKMRRVMYGVIVTILSVCFVIFHVPVLLVWIGTALLKSFTLKQWRLASIIVSTAILPLATGTGSPTYAVFVLMATCYASVYNFERYEEFLLSRWYIPVAFVICLVVLFFPIKGGTRIPVVSKLLNPIIAEQERTLQLEAIINWNKASRLPTRRLELFDAARNPSDAKDAVDRTHRAPTTQEYLDTFMQADLPSAPDDSSCYVVTFGDKEIPGKQLVHSVPGRQSGAALVFQ